MRVNGMLKLYPAWGGRGMNLSTQDAQLFFKLFLAILAYTNRQSATAARGGGLEYMSRSKRLAFGGFAYGLNVPVSRLAATEHRSGFSCRSA